MTRQARNLLLPPDMPSRMKDLPVDSVGRPVPFFVPWTDEDGNELPPGHGKPDFRLMTMPHLIQAVRDQVCWTCGKRLNRLHRTTAPRGSFVVGPMCLINRTSAEPPSHDECGTWAAKACPFLNNPKKLRRDSGYPEGAIMEEPAGLMLERNPGVTAVIACEKWEVWNPGNGLLWNFKQITNCAWWAEGRPAHPEEIVASIDSGLPQLMALAEEEGVVRELAAKTRAAMKWVGATSLAPFENLTAVLKEAP